MTDFQSIKTEVPRTESGEYKNTQGFVMNSSASVQLEVVLLMVEQF
jgi:hypothetical protein